MKTTVFAIFLAGMFAMPSLAGLKFVGTPNKDTFAPGESGTITLSLMVDPANPGGSNDVVFISPADGQSSFGFQFVGGPGTAPTIGVDAPVDPFVNSILGVGWSTPFSIIPPAPAQPITVLPGAPVDFATIDFVYNALGTFDLSVDSLQATDGNGAVTALLSGIVPGSTVTAIPEPSSFLFLGLVGSGVAGARMYRRRKAAKADENEEEEAAS